MASMAPGDGLTTIDLFSLKEQLKLLGHELPDSQIMDILSGMNISCAAPPDTGERQSWCFPLQRSAPSWEQQPPLPSLNSSWSQPPLPPPAYPSLPRASLSGGVPPLPTLYEEEDAVVTRLSNEASAADLYRTNTQAYSQQPAANASTGVEKQAHEWYGCLHNTTDFKAPAGTTIQPSWAMSRSQDASSSHIMTEPSDDLLPQLDTHDTSHAAPRHHTSFSRPTTSPALPKAQGPGHHHHHDGAVSDCVSDQEDGAVDDILARYYGGHARSSSGVAPRQDRPDQRATAPRAPSNPPGGHDDDDDDEEGDARYEAQRHHSHSSQPQAYQQQRFTRAAGNEAVHLPSRPAAGAPSLLRLVTGDAEARTTTRPAKFRWDEALRSDGPTRPAPSLSGRSVATSSAAGGRARKGDVVARYAQLQNTWKRDRFLSSTSTQPLSASSSRTATMSTTRKPLAFNAYFKALHAAEQASKDMAIKMSRTQTAHAPGTFVPPTNKRRDALRWETRQRMHQAAE